MAEIVKPKDIAKILENIPENQIASAAEELGVKPEQLTKFVNKPTGKAFEKIAETLGEGLEGAQKFVDKFLQRGAAEVPPPPPKPLALPPAAVEPAPALPAVVTPPGPLSPRMQSLGSKAQKGVIDVEPLPTRPALPAGQTSQTRTQQALEAATAPKQPEMTPVPKKAKAGAAAAGLGALALGAGFSKQANAPTAIAAAQVDKVEDIKGLANNAEAQGAVTPEQKVVFEQQAEQVNKASQSLEKMLLKEYQRDKARVELMQLTETIMNGLVTAIGANALLNRGSPYAVDFSKGPKTDWAGEFDRLQKDFKTQMDAINEKYKLEAQEKREAERAAAQESRFVRDQELEREKLAARETRESQTAAAAATTAENKALEKQNKAYSQLRKAVENKKPGDVERFGFEAGLPDEDIEAIKKEMGKGWFRKTYDSFEALLSNKEAATLSSILKKYRPGQAAPAAPAAAPVDNDRALLEELRARKAAQQKGG